MFQNYKKTLRNLEHRLYIVFRSETLPFPTGNTAQRAAVFPGPGTSRRYARKDRQKMTNVEYYNYVIERIAQKRKKAHPYGEDTTAEEMNALLTSIAASLACIADHFEGEK